VTGEPCVSPLIATARRTIAVTRIQAWAEVASPLVAAALSCAFQD
jgi:hypothetical protein